MYGQMIGQKNSVKANIKMTRDAVDRVWHLMRLEDVPPPALFLRVAISGGGCSGFQYDFTFERAHAPDDYFRRFLVPDRRCIKWTRTQKKYWTDFCLKQQWMKEGQRTPTLWSVLKRRGADPKCIKHIDAFCRQHAPQKYPWIWVVVDPISHLYLAEATLDYLFDAQGERFIVMNPNAATTCGCGSSFSV